MSRPLCTVLGCRRPAGRIMRGETRKTLAEREGLCAEHRRTHWTVGNSRRYNAEARAAVALVRACGSDAARLALGLELLARFADEADARAWMAIRDRVEAATRAA